MTQYILTNIFLLSIGLVLFLVVRSLPRVGEDGESAQRRQTLLERLVTSDIPNRLDAMTNVFLGKVFRRLKIHLLRFDNYLTERLKRMTPEGNGDSKPKIDFRQVAGEETGESILETAQKAEKRA